jgi:hypothetical protein
MSNILRLATIILTRAGIAKVEVINERDLHICVVTPYGERMHFYGADARRVLAWLESD